MAETALSRFAGGWAIERERGREGEKTQSGAGKLSRNAHVKKFINTTPRCHCELSAAEEKRHERARALVLQSGISHKSHFTRYILNSVPLPGKTRLKIVARFHGTFRIIQRIAGKLCARFRAGI